jgi:hypothetical protein
MAKKSNLNDRTSPVLEGTQKRSWWRKLPNFVFWVVKLIGALTKLFDACTKFLPALKGFITAIGSFFF